MLSKCVTFVYAQLSQFEIEKNRNTEVIADNPLSRERTTRWLRLFKTIDSIALRCLKSIKLAKTVLYRYNAMKLEVREEKEKRKKSEPKQIRYGSCCDVTYIVTSMYTYTRPTAYSQLHEHCSYYLSLSGSFNCISLGRGCC